MDDETVDDETVGRFFFVFFFLETAYLAPATQTR